MSEFIWANEMPPQSEDSAEMSSLVTEEVELPLDLVEEGENLDDILMDQFVLLQDCPRLKGGIRALKFDERDEFPEGGNKEVEEIDEFDIEDEEEEEEEAGGENQDNEEENHDEERDTEEKPEGIEDDDDELDPLTEMQASRAPPASQPINIGGESQASSSAIYRAADNMTLSQYRDQAFERLSQMNLFRCKPKPDPQPLYTPMTFTSTYKVVPGSNGILAVLPIPIVNIGEVEERPTVTFPDDAPQSADTNSIKIEEVTASSDENPGGSTSEDSENIIIDFEATDGDEPVAAGYRTITERQLLDQIKALKFSLPVSEEPSINENEVDDLNKEGETETETETEVEAEADPVEPSPPEPESPEETNVAGSEIKPFNPQIYWSVIELQASQLEGLLDNSLILQQKLEEIQYKAAQLKILCAPFEEDKEPDQPETSKTDTSNVKGVISLANQSDDKEKEKVRPSEEDTSDTNDDGNSDSGVDANSDSGVEANNERGEAAEPTPSTSKASSNESRNDKGKGKRRNKRQATVNSPNDDIVTKTMTVPTNKVGRIVGKAGNRIRDIENQSGASVQINRTNQPVTVITLRGKMRAIAIAEDMIGMVVRNFKRLNSEESNAGQNNESVAGTSRGSPGQEKTLEVTIRFKSGENQGRE